MFLCVSGCHWQWSKQYQRKASAAEECITKMWSSEVPILSVAPLNTAAATFIYCVLYCITVVLYTVQAQTIGSENTSLSREQVMEFPYFIAGTAFPWWVKERLHGKSGHDGWYIWFSHHIIIAAKVLSFGGKHTDRMHNGCLWVHLAPLNVLIYFWLIHIMMYMFELWNSV